MKTAFQAVTESFTTNEGQYPTTHKEYFKEAKKLVDIYNKFVDGKANIALVKQQHLDMTTDKDAANFEDEMWGEMSLKGQSLKEYLFNIDSHEMRLCGDGSCDTLKGGWSAVTNELKKIFSKVTNKVEK